MGKILFKIDNFLAVKPFIIVKDENKHSTKMRNFVSK